MQTQEEGIEENIPESPETTAQKAKEVLQTVQARIHNPIDQSAESAVKLTTKKQLKQVLDTNVKESLKRGWSSAKAMTAGVLSLIPILGGAGEASLADAAVLEGATKTEAQALAKGAVVTASGEVTYPLTKLLGETAAKRVVGIVKTIDPFENVHPAIVAASGVAEMMGVEGAGLIPPAIQIITNEVGSIKQGFRAAKEVTDILRQSTEAEKAKNFARSTLEHIRGRLDKATQPNMVAAARAFA